MLKPISSHVAVLAAGLGLGAAGIAIASPSNPQAHSAASDSRIVNELRKVNKNLVILNKSVGGYEYIAPSDSLNELLKKVQDNTEATCNNTRNIEGAYKSCY